MAMTLIEPVASSGGRQQRQHYKMSITFLAGEFSELGHMDTENTDSCYPSAPETAPAPASASSQVYSLVNFRVPCYQPEQRATNPVTLPSLQLDRSPHSVPSHTQLPRIGSVSSLSSFNHAALANSRTGSNVSCPSSANSFSSINASRIKRHDSLFDTESTSSASSKHLYSSFSGINAPLAQNAQQQQQHQLTMRQPSQATTSAVTKRLARKPRSARPSYSEEQRFFIMYYRVIRAQSWPEIEDKFAHFFKLRSKDGLTSVYYRIRKIWGMEEVLKARPDGSTGDRRKVEDKAAQCSREFLTNLGYFD